MATKSLVAGVPVKQWPGSTTNDDVIYYIPKHATEFKPIVVNLANGNVYQVDASGAYATATTETDVGKREATVIVDASKLPPAIDRTHAAALLCFYESAIQNDGQKLLKVQKAKGSANLIYSDLVTDGSTPDLNTLFAAQTMSRKRTEQMEIEEDTTDQVEVTEEQRQQQMDDDEEQPEEDY